MNEKEVFEAGLKSLEKIAEFSASEMGAAAERLEAMAKVTADIPWDMVATLSIGWRTVEYKDGDSGGVELLPTLDVVMKEQLT